jgi:hypothetical protein
MSSVRFPPLATNRGQTACPGGPTTPRIEADDQTVSPCGQIALGTEASNQTASQGGQTTPRPCAAPSSPALLTSAAPRVACTTSVVPHMAPSTPHAPRVAPASATTVAPPVAPEPYPLHYSCRPRAAQEPLHQQSLPAKAVPVAPPVNPHPMTTWAK